MQSGWRCPALIGCLSSLVSNSFLSRSGWWCPALWRSVFTCLPIHLSASLAGGLPFFDACLDLSQISNLSHSLTGGVRLFGCLSSLVSQFMCPKSGYLSPNSCVPSLAGGFRLFTCLKMDNTSSTPQGGGGSFKNRKPIGGVSCCGSRMAGRIHWWTDRWLELCFLEWLQWLQWLPCHNCWM